MDRSGILSGGATTLLGTARPLRSASLSALSTLFLPVCHPVGNHRAWSSLSLLPPLATGPTTWSTLFHLRCPILPICTYLFSAYSFFSHFSRLVKDCRRGARKATLPVALFPSMWQRGTVIMDRNRRTGRGNSFLASGFPLVPFLESGEHGKSSDEFVQSSGFHSKEILSSGAERVGAAGITHTYIHAYSASSRDTLKAS